MFESRARSVLLGILGLQASAFAAPENVTTFRSYVDSKHCKPLQSYVFQKCESQLGYEVFGIFGEPGGLQLGIDSKRIALNPMILKAFGRELGDDMIDVQPVLGWRALREGGKLVPLSLAVEVKLGSEHRIVVFRLQEGSACLVGSVEVAGSSGSKDQLRQRVNELAVGDASRLSCAQ